MLYIIIIIIIFFFFINKKIENYSNEKKFLDYDKYIDFNLETATDTEKSRIYDWCSNLLVKQCCTVRNTCSHFGFDNDNYPECQMLSHEQRSACPGFFN
jgi:hypothetical protein